MDEAQKAKLETTPCPTCGGEKMYGACCGKEEMCFCGSGKKCSECCMVTPEEHAAM